MLKSLGALETFDYKLPATELANSIIKITDGKLYRTFDAAAFNYDFVKELYAQIDGKKYFTTTNDWTPYAPAEYGDAIIKPVELGPIGRATATETNALITKAIPLMYHLLETGAVKPAEYELIGETGFDSVSEAWAYQMSGKGGSKKVVVKLLDA
jgi:hypothetical protein